MKAPFDSHSEELAGPGATGWESLEQEGMWTSHKDPWGRWKEQLRRALITHRDLTGPVQRLHPVLQVLLVTGLQEIALGQSVDNCQGREGQGELAAARTRGAGVPTEPPTTPPTHQSRTEF